MADLARLTPALFTGADLPDDHDLALEDLREWERFGVTHVIDTRIEWSDEELVVGTLEGVRYLHIGVDDAGQRMPDNTLCLQDGQPTNGVGHRRGHQPDPLTSRHAAAGAGRAAHRPLRTRPPGFLSPAVASMGPCLR